AVLGMSRPRYRHPAARRSAAVVHPGVLHPQHLRRLIRAEAAVHALADEQRGAPRAAGLADLAVEPRHTLREDRRPRAALEDGEAVERGPVILFHRLAELAHERAVPARHGA